MGPFDNVGNVPFNINVLSSLFPGCSHITEKARALVDSGKIIRLKMVVILLLAKKVIIGLTKKAIQIVMKMQEFSLLMKMLIVGEKQKAKVVFKNY